MVPFWEALYDADAEVVLGGHAHHYERFAPQTPSGQEDQAQGIREFVVGTGGNGLNSFGTVKANSQVRNANTLRRAEADAAPHQLQLGVCPRGG